MKLNFDVLTTWYDQPLDSIQEINGKKKDLEAVEDISSCTKLRKLILTENSLSNSTINLAGLDHLTFLNLSFNELTSFEGLEHLNELIVLNLSNNAIQALPTNLPCYTHLKALILNNNRISKLKSLRSLFNLNTLVLSHNRLNVIPSLASMTDLAKLSAAHNKLKEFPELPTESNALKELRLNDNRITVIPSTLRQCQSLEIIDLGNNQISKWSDIAPLGSLLNLHNLNLKGNPLASNDGYKDKILALVPSLRVLDGERFDMKFLERKQKQATNLKLMEKKDRLKREKLEKKLESEQGMEIERKPRHKQLLRDENKQLQSESLTKSKSKPKQKVKEEVTVDSMDVDKEEKRLKRKKDQSHTTDGGEKVKPKKKKHDAFFDTKADVSESKEVPSISDQSEASVTDTITPTNVKATRTKLPSTVAAETTVSPGSKKEKTVLSKESVDKPQQPRHPISQRQSERTGVLSVEDKSKKIKKKANVDVVVALEKMKEQKEQESVSTGLGADAWD